VSAAAPSGPPARIAVLGAGFWARFQIAAWGEVPGADNLKSLALVFAAYESARSGQTVALAHPERVEKILLKVSE
jgi:hypothetical protein